MTLTRIGRFCEVTMHDALDQIIAMRLAPLLDRIALLEAQIESGRRRANNAILLGRIQSVSGHRCTVVVGKNTTPPIKWFSAAAGDVAHYRQPSVGETTLLLNYGAGDNLQGCIALVGIDSDDFPFPTDNPDWVYTQIAQSYLYWDKAVGKLVIHAPGGVEFVDTPYVRNVHGELGDQVRNLSDDRTIYNSHRHPHGEPMVGAVSHTH
ncbi:MAG: hypothetical protein ACRDC6_01045 [Shewanella sp.]